MLLSIAVTNFRSIKDRVELTMLKSALKGLSNNYFSSAKKNILSSSVIYGPNASGKSGFIRAFQALGYLVNNSADFKPDKKIGPYEPFILDEKTSDQSVAFEISFLVNKIQYDYRIAFSKFKIEEEELSYYPNHTKTLLFIRLADKEMKFGDYYRGAKKTLEKLLLPNQLFLSKAVENNVEMLLEPYRFFANHLLILPLINNGEDDLARLYARRLAENKNSSFSKKFNALICALDTGITNVSVEEEDWSRIEFRDNISTETKAKIMDKYKYSIKTQHPVYSNGKAIGSENFEIDKESAGTQNLFGLGGIIIEALENGNLLVVDELEKSLHPSITQFLIKLFHNPLINTKNAQLLFATHDITQLSNDNFRRDQVWFTQKNEFGITDLFRCSDIPGIRLGTPLDKWYATGRFGATPIINDVDFLITMQDTADEKDD